MHDQNSSGINPSGGNRHMYNADGSLNQIAKDLNRENYLNFMRMKNSEDRYKISAYGMTNEHEFFAETFVMYHRKDPTLPEQQVEYFDRYFKLTK